VILSAGLSPAWQQILVFERFRPGEVNRAQEVHWCSSGKVLNAGIAAGHLSKESLALAAVGGTVLDKIEREFRALGIPRHWVVSESATRICTTIVDRSSGAITELVENGHPLAAAELDEFRRAYSYQVARAEVAVLIGSLPAGTPRSFYRDLLKLTPCPAVLDFRGGELLLALELEPYVVKPNREELARTVGKPLDGDDELLAAMRWLNGRGAQWMVVTGGSGPVWVTSSSKAYRFHPPPAREVVNPIGCGDAMAAAIAWATSDGRDLPQAVRLGIAAALENLRQLLPGRLDRARVEELAERVRLEVI